MLGKRKMLIQYMVIWGGWARGKDWRIFMLTILLIFLNFIILD